MRVERLFQRPISLRFFSALSSLFAQVPRPTTPERPSEITPRIAQDIGLTPAEMERLNWHHPSTRIRHPML